jgi:hypothetical protein
LPILVPIGMNAIRIFTVATIAYILVSAASSGATYSLAPSADARIITLGAGTAYERSNYGSDILSVYTLAVNRQRTLMTFDLSAVVLASGERIGSAILTLYASTYFGDSDGAPINVYRILAPWQESTVTWLKRNATDAWLNPGSDFSGNGLQPFGSVVSSAGNLDPVNLNVTELVDLWVEQVLPNYGLLLTATEGNRLTFLQDEDPEPSRRPRLTITTMPGPPRLRVQLDAVTGEVSLSWRSATGITLEQAADTAATAVWSAAGLPITEHSGISHATAPPSGSKRYFRLRSGP